MSDSIALNNWNLNLISQVEMHLKKHPYNFFLHKRLDNIKVRIQFKYFYFYVAFLEMM